MKRCRVLAAAVAALVGLLAPSSEAQTAGAPPGPGLEVLVSPYNSKFIPWNFIYRYDKETGAAGISKNGQFNWGSGWTHIVPFGGWQDSVFFYNRARGLGQVRRVERFSFLSAPAHAYTELRRDWDIITRVGTRCILFYSRQGHANMYFASQKDGSLGKHVFQTNQWTKDWSHIVDLPTGVLFYKRSTGTARIERTHTGCVLGDTTYYTKEWSKNWTHILYIQGSKVITQGVDAILFYDGRAGAARIYEYERGTRKVGRLLHTYSNFRKSWDIIEFREMGKNQNGLHFYDSETGAHNFYILKHNASLGERFK